MTNITQEDRDLFIEITGHGGKAGEKINAGEWFTAEVEMIARHREAAEAKERERIVAYLRDQENKGFDRMRRAPTATSERNYAAAAVAIQKVADWIERGEHMEANNATSD